MKRSQLDIVIASLDAEILALQMQRQAIIERMQKVIPARLLPPEQPKLGRPKRKGLPNGAPVADEAV